MTSPSVLLVGRAWLGAALNAFSTVVAASLVVGLFSVLQSWQDSGLGRGASYRLIPQS
jgi:hypothetical protein